ncbi:HlyD family secretion protein [Spiribacter pallidus]|uniref:HlyD family efflux transporter periplasmic adaptor subunit n=1 Tax=Spiribacter pallidus TaxID=1987936 RepID=A0ABV3T985_9GAMM
MNIDFRGEPAPQRSNGLPVRYAPARRAIPRLRWALVALIVTSPILYLGWVVLRGGWVVESTGRLTYETTRIGSVVGGVVSEVLVSENDTVTPGQTLFRLENPAINARVEHLLDELDRLSAEQLAARRRSEAELAVLDEQITALENLIDEQHEWLSQIELLSRSGAVTRAERRRANAELQRSRGDLIRAIGQRQALARSIAQGDPQLREREQALRLSLDMARADRSYLSVKAPDPGSVIELNVEPGDTVGPGSTLLTLARPSRPRLTAYLPPADGAFVQRNRPVTVHLPDGSQLTGRVSDRPTLTGRIPDPMQSIFRESDTALMVRIRLDRPVPASMAVHGLPVEVEFDRGITVMLARMDLIPAFASEAPGLH